MSIIIQYFEYSLALPSLGLEWKLTVSIFVVTAEFFKFTAISIQLLICVQLFGPHGLQHTGLPCLSPTPGAYSNSCNYISDVIQPSQLLSYPSPPAFNLSQHQGLFQWVGFSDQVAKVLWFQLQHQSFQLIFRTDFL